MTKQPQWRIKQIAPNHFCIEKRNWLGFWCELHSTNTLQEAQHDIEQAIVASRTYPRVVQTFNSDVEYVRQKLST
jgi:hypothetical protein